MVLHLKRPTTVSVDHGTTIRKRSIRFQENNRAEDTLDKLDLAIQRQVNIRYTPRRFHQLLVGIMGGLNLEVFKVCSSSFTLTTGSAEY